VEAPDGAIFFRAFHQLRRYATEQDKGKGVKANIGFTEINQGTREYALLQGPLTIYVGIPEPHREAVAAALRNRDHIGTHDSLCSLIGDVESGVPEPVDVLYEPLADGTVSIPQTQPTAVVTLSRITSSDFGSQPPHWKITGGENTELTPFLISGTFRGTRNGKIYQKRPALAWIDATTTKD